MTAMLKGKGIFVIILVIILKMMFFIFKIILGTFPGFGFSSPFNIFQPFSWCYQTLQELCSICQTEHHLSHQLLHCGDVQLPYLFMGKFLHNTLIN